MVIDSPYYSVYEELASPEQTATGKDVSNPLVLVITKVSSSPRVSSYLVKAYQIYLFDSAVHRVHAVSFDVAMASTVSTACIVADVAAYCVSAAPQSSCFAKIYLETWN
ncbi:hypothetical protein Tco_1528087 [Tanacetum coccineum]